MFLPIQIDLMKKLAMKFGRGGGGVGIVGV